MILTGQIDWTQIWENTRTYPDEDGIVHPITDDEREEIASL